MRPQLRLAATAAALLALSQPAMAQGKPCIAPADMADAMTYSIPLVVDGLQSTCADTLPNDSFLMAQGDEFASGFEPLRAAAWSGARRFLMSFADEGGQKSEATAFIKNLGDDALRPFVDAIVVQLVAAEIKPATCGDIDSLLPLLAPLPPENYGPLFATLFGFVGDEKDNLKICKD